MKKLIVGALVVGVAGLGVAQAGEAVNLFTNGSFETAVTDSGTIAEGWFGNGHRETKGGVDGSACAYVHINEVMSNLVSVAAAGQYRFTGKVHGRYGERINECVKVLANDVHKLTFTSFASSWSDFDLFLDLDAGETWIRLVGVDAGSYRDRYMYFDDLRLVRLPFRVPEAIPETEIDRATGKAEPKPVLTSYEGVVLEEGKDYELSYANNTAPGAATVTILGLGAYADAAPVTLPFKAVWQVNVLRNGGFETMRFAIYSDRGVSGTFAACGLASWLGTGSVGSNGGMVSVKPPEGQCCTYLNKAQVMSNDFTVAEAGQYMLSCRFLGRTYECLSHLVKFHFDTTHFMTTRTRNATTWETARYIGDLPAGHHWLRLVGVDPGAYGDRTTCFDDFRLVRLPFRVPTKLADVVWDGVTGEPKAKVEVRSYADEVLEEGKDYELVYANNTEFGAATVTVRGLGDYAGIADIPLAFNVVRELNLISNGGFESLLYPMHVPEHNNSEGRGEAKTFAETGCDDWLGTARVTVKGGRGLSSAPPEGFHCVSIEIAEVMSNKFTVAEAGVYVFSFKTCGQMWERLEHEVDFYLNDKSICHLVHNSTSWRTVSLTLNLEPGEYWLKVKGVKASSYASRRSFYDDFRLVRAPFRMENPLPDLVWDGVTENPEPELEVRSPEGELLVRDVDYALEISDHAPTGAATATLTGLGAYAGTTPVVLPFNIVTPNCAGISYFAKPDGSETSDCLTWATAGTLSNAFSRLTSGTAARPNAVVLKAGTPQTPACYEFTDVEAWGGRNYALTSSGLNYAKITTFDADLDPRTVLVVGGGEQTGKGFFSASGNTMAGIVLEGLTISNFVQKVSGAAVVAGRDDSGYNNDLALSRCRIVNCSSAGSLVLVPRRIVGTEFVGNTGSPLVANGVNMYRGLITVRDTAFVSNTVTTVLPSRLNAVTNCLFVGNTYSSRLLNSATYVNCLIARNSAKEGALAENNHIWLLSAQGGAARLDNCTVVDNACGTGAGEGAIGTANNNTVTVRNSVVYGNTPYDIAKVSSFPWTNPQVVQDCLYGTTAQTFASASSNNLQVTENPLSAKIDAAHPYGYGVKRLSPARDAGHDLGQTAADTDAAGLPRVVGAAIDIGCYERQPSKSGLLILVK